MRLLAVTFIFISLILSFDFSMAQENEHFPALMYLVIEPVGPAVAEVAPLHHYSFKFKFYNGGYFQKNLYAFYTEFRVKVEGKDWKAYVEPTNTFFYPSEKKYGFVHVEAGARPSNFAIIHVYGRFKDIYGFWHHGNYTFQVKSTQYHSFDAKIGITYLNAKQDEIYSIPITVRNFGNYEDRFFLSPEYYPPGWKITFSDPVLVIPPGGEATTYIHFATPHEKIYLQYSTYLIRVRVGIVQDSSQKMVAMIVSMEGINFTPGQYVALLATMPSIFMLAFIGILFKHYKNPCNFIPKPWKEEKEELEKLDKKERKRIIKDMKEEWLSGYNYCINEFRNKKKLEKLKKIKDIKQKKLKEKIEKEWRNLWEDINEKWRNEVKKIDDEYQKRKRAIEKKLKELNKIASSKGIKIEITLPKLHYPPKPKKPIMPEIPEYILDEKRLILIEPDEIMVKRALLQIKNNKVIMNGERIKIERMSKEIIGKINMEFDSIERKINAELMKMRKKSSKELIKELKK